jgi:hypothetical protein
LGQLTAKGTSFEHLKAAIARVAGQPSAAGRDVELSNDAAFENFILGRSPIYCGGALNSLLIERWWASTDPANFVEILAHKEIEPGFTPRRVRKGQGRCFVENYVDFSEQARGRADFRKSEDNIVRLFRSIGRGLKDWGSDVMRRPERLNGLGTSCEAARRILEPLPDYRSGHYAFVTDKLDPALLMRLDDYYEVQSTRRRGA